MVEKMAFSKHLHTAVHAVSSYTILLFQNCPPQFMLDIYKKQNKNESCCQDKSLVTTEQKMQKENNSVTSFKNKPVNDIL